MTFRAGKCLGCRKPLQVDTRVRVEDEVCFLCVVTVPSRALREVA